MFGKRKDDEIMDGQSTSAKKTERKVPELTTMVRTATGNRKYQQDAVYITKSKVLASNKKTRVLALVCDGMGGMADGGRASQTDDGARLSKGRKSSGIEYSLFFSAGNPGNRPGNLRISENGRKRLWNNDGSLYRRRQQALLGICGRQPDLYYPRKSDAAGDQRS